jgi:uncharacterized SAM-binding protein YcdF (DUF218 family)
VLANAHLMHFLKQLVGVVATPLMCGFLIAFAGAIVRLSGWRRISTVLWIGAACLVYLAATAPVADALLGPLEHRFSAINDVRNLPPVRYIVVLGSGYAPRDGIPITAALGDDSLARIAEGVRLLRKVHGASLVVSGGASEHQTATAIGYAQFAVEFGVDPDSIVSLDKPLDTADEAGSIVAVVGKSPFILVTSSYHMPRAVRLMQLAGMQPIPAPTAQRTSGQIDFSARGWLPSSESLRKTERALHEYLGLLIVN